MTESYNRDIQWYDITHDIASTWYIHGIVYSWIKLVLTSLKTHRACRNVDITTTCHDIVKSYAF